MTNTTPLPKNPLHSKTILGVLVTALGSLSGLAGIDVLPGELQALAEALLVLGGSGLAIYGRYRADRPLKQPGRGLPLLLCAALAMAVQPGCNSLSESGRETLRETAKVASQVALIQLLKGTPEAQPYIPSLMRAVDAAYQSSDDPAEIGRALAEGLAIAVADYATRQLLLDIVASDLTAPPPDDGITSGPPGYRAYQRELAEGLTTAREGLRF